LLKYDYQTGQVRTLPHTFDVSFSEFSFGGHNIAFFKQVRLKSRRWHHDLWIMDTDGKDARILLNASDPDSPFHQYIFSNHCLLSSDGTQVAFTSETHSRNPLETRITLWWMSTQGSSPQHQTFALSGNYVELNLWAWDPDESWIVLSGNERSVSNRHIANRIYKFDIASGEFQVLVDDIPELYTPAVSPDQKYLAARVRKAELAQILVVDLDTSEKRIVSDTIRMFGRFFKWDQQSEKLLFYELKGNLSFYDVQADSLREIYALPAYAGGLSFAWVDDHIVVLDDALSARPVIKILSQEGRLVRSMDTPAAVKMPKALWGAKNRVLLDTDSGSLWSLDLETEEWKKVY
jgi:hypothetical protein